MNTCDFTLPSEINIIATTIEDIIGYLENLCGSFADSTLFELKVILNELIINAIIHGNKGDVKKKVKVNAGLTDNQYIYILVEDEGEGYDFKFKSNNNSHSETESVIFDLNETGRGLIIVKSISDKVFFNKKGNRVVVLKKNSQLQFA